MKDLETNYFTKKYLLKDMRIYKNITMEDIIKKVKLINPKKGDYIYFNDIEGEELELYISYSTDHKFSFVFKDIVGEKIFRKPIEYVDGKRRYQIISEEQFEYILSDYKKPLIKCNITNKLINPTIYDFLNHVVNHNDKLTESFEYNILSQNDFNDYFKKKEFKFIKRTFVKPSDFEKNFEYYFNYNNKLQINSDFYIYDDALGTREFFSDNILKFKKEENIKFYYGTSGKGKSITLIGTLKFRENFYEYGSIYINCKTLKTLLKEKKSLIAKQILIDEALFLFPINYSKYKVIIDIIKSYVFLNESSYLNLVDKIMDTLEPNKKYIIAFDQYNDSNDPNHYIKNEIIKKREDKKDIKFILFASMNETDIREIKKNILLGVFQEIKYHELEYLCEIPYEGLNLDKKSALKKLGDTFKALLEIKSTNNIEHYLKFKKYKYTKKILCFYIRDEYKIEKYLNDREQKIIDIPYEIIGKFMSFKIDYFYDKDYFIKIIDNVPFRFFDFIEDNEKYEIKYTFPLIEEVMKNIYKFIALKYTYNTIQNVLNDKGSGLGTLFEMKVIHTLSEITNYFKNFIISEKYEIHVIVSKKNENFEPKKKLVLKENTTYLIEQEIFNGKTLDCLIIQMKINEPIIFGLQISIFKEHIFKNDELIESYKKMVDNLEKIFCIDIKYENTFFGYIFDYSRLGGKDYAEED